MTSIEEKNGNIDTIPRNEDPALIRRPEDVDDLLLTGGKSPGVLRVEAIAAHFTLVDKVFFWISILLVSYVYTLDDTIRYTYSVRFLASKMLILLLTSLVFSRMPLLASTTLVNYPQSMWLAVSLLQLLRSVSTCCVNVFSIAEIYQPTAAKIADVFGRVELIGLSVVFYVVGTSISSLYSHAKDAYTTQRHHHASSCT